MSIQRYNSPSLPLAGLAAMLSLMSPSWSTAQTRYKPVLQGSGSAAIYKAASRNIGSYPLTAQGNTAFDSYITSSSNLPVVDRPKAGAVVGKYNYNVALSGTDYRGQAFITTLAPNLVDFSRTTARPLGNYYPLEPQSAQNTLLLRRLPPIAPHPAKTIVYGGPNFTDQSDREAIPTRGYTALAESVPNRGNILAGRDVDLIGGGYRDVAKNALGGLPASDPRYAWIYDYAYGLKFVDNEAAGKLLGQYLYYSNPNRYGYSLDFEDLQQSSRSGNDFGSQWTNMLGYVMQGIKETAQSQGRATPWQLPYDRADLSRVTLRFNDENQTGYHDGIGNYDADPGIPFFYSYAAIGTAFGGGSKSAPIGAATPFAQYAKNNVNIAVGSAEYMRNTWDDEPLYKTDAQGNPEYYTFPNGKKNFRYRDDARNTTIYGRPTQILGVGQYNEASTNSVTEAANFTYHSYERVQQALVDLFFRSGGKHLPLSTERQPGWENLKLAQWFRLDAEFKNTLELPADQINPTNGQVYDQEALNHRPLNPDFVEGDVIAHYLLRDALRQWGASEPTIAQGQSTPPSVYNSFTSKGTFETFSKGIHRASQLNFLSDVPWRLVCPRFLIRNNEISRPYYDPNEAFEKKPMVFGGIVPNYNNKTYLWMYWRYPIQNVNANTQMLCWVENPNGGRTDAFKMVFVGRKTGLDYWEVPAWVKDVDPNQIRFQFTDLTGEKQTWSGDYRNPVLYTNHPTPPPIASFTGDIYR